MIIQTKTASGDLLYLQKFDDSKTLNAVVAHLMQLPRGTAFATTVTNNGHDLGFSSDQLDLRVLTHTANGPTPRKGGS